MILPFRWIASVCRLPSRRRHEANPAGLFEVPPYDEEVLLPAKQPRHVPMPLRRDPGTRLVESSSYQAALIFPALLPRLSVTVGSVQRVQLEDTKPVKHRVTRDDWIQEIIL